ncbi:MAG TPA: hypothetical protein VEJ89_14200 [Myxococcaceae bacterium]|nr:hypothetical protein [Myxococcaceae bacterium]
MTTMRALACTLCAAWAGVAAAQQPPTDSPTVATEPPREAPAASSPSSDREVTAEGGYPGVFVEYLGGMSPSFSLGGKFTFNYGLEGDIHKYAPGIKLQAVLLFVLPQLGPFTPTVRVDPGLYSYFFGQRPTVGGLRAGPGPGPTALTAPPVPHGGQKQASPYPPYYGSSYDDQGPSYYGTLYATVIPVSYQVAFPMVPRWTGRLAIGVTPNITFGNGNGGFVLPIQAGAGLSYALQPGLELRIDYVVGPRIYFGSGTNLAIDAWVGVGWHP